MTEERLNNCVSELMGRGFYYCCGWMCHNDLVKPRDVRRAISQFCAPKNYWESEQIMQALRQEGNDD